MDKREFIKKLLESSDCKTRVIATHKMTDAWKKLWREYTDLITKARELEAKANTVKKKFWNKVEGELEDFDHSMKVDDENWTIEVHEDDCENCESK